MKISTNKVFNQLRHRSYQYFTKTLEGVLLAEDKVSEANFAQRWLSQFKPEEAFLTGWYQPPPKGLSVLFGSSKDFRRVSFGSLRERINWPREDVFLDKKEGIIFAYCSPVCRKTGLMGDFSCTLYLGNDTRLKEYFNKTNEATDRIVGLLSEIKNSKQLYIKSNEILKEYGLKNCIVSKTDTAVNDLGHVYTKLDVEDTQFNLSRALTEQQIKELSSSRRFINDKTSWDFEEGLQFTIEPQLRDCNDESLPQVSYHYLARKTEDGFEVQNESEIRSAGLS